ncbi:putative peptide zinc metalloprotease protein [Rathayibacter agropyri]
MTQISKGNDVTQVLRLTNGVTRSVTVDNRLLLRTPVGRFIAVPKGCAPIIDRLEEGCSFDNLRALILSAHDTTIEKPHADASLHEFIASLQNSGFIDGALVQPSRADRFLRRAGVDFLARLAVPVDIDRVADILAKPLRRIPISLLLVISLCISSVGIAAGLGTVSRHRSSLSQPPLTTLCIVLVMVLLQLAIHEVCHAVAMRAQGARVREIGVGLLYYFVPVAYVNRTEAYTVQSRPGLVLIALAGPLLDASLIGAAAIGVLAVDGDAQQTLVLYITAELLLLIANCNPLFRSDGYHALEAAFGMMNIRSRAFTILINALLRRRQPAHIRSLPAHSRVGLIAYALGSIVYLIAVLVNLSQTILMTVLGAPS